MALHTVTALATIPAIAITLATFSASIEPEPDRAGWRETQWSAHLAESVDGVAEYRLPNGARVDIVEEVEGGPRIAWEVDWSTKGAEAIGQAVQYAAQLNAESPTEPGVWLLLKGRSDEDYLECLAGVTYLRGF